MIHQKPTYRDGAVHKDRWLYVCGACGERFESEQQLRYHRKTDCAMNRSLPDFWTPGARAAVEEPLGQPEPQIDELGGVKTA